MNRAWLAAVVALLCACGGKTEVSPAPTQDGGAGAGGSSGHGGAGLGGSGGGTGGTTGSWTSCQGPGWCVELHNGCCQPCGLEKITDLSGVNRDPAQQQAFRASQCSEPAPDCPNCATMIDPNLAAFCVSSQCQVIDVRTDEVSACTSDSDCVMRYPECCEECGGPNPSMLIAINASKSGLYSSQVCEPNGGGACPPCVPVYPTDWMAYCGSDGHCQVAQVQTPGGCPANPPDAGAACSQGGMTCQWGTDPRPACREGAMCSGGQWVFGPIPNCVPLPPPGVAGCPTSMAVSGSQCAGLEGTICNMSTVGGEGAMCVCDQCLGGPCSQYGRWWCDKPGAQCPSWAPNVGQACATEGQQCIYGACGTKVSVGRVCSSGLWQDQTIACPE